MNELTHLDLFSGIGGFSLAFEAEGFRTIAFCESDDYAQKTLIKNFAAVMADAAEQRRNTREEKTGIHAVSNSESDLRRTSRHERPKPSDGTSPRIFPDIRTLDGTQFYGVTVLTAGVPCQPASQAGKRRGEKDDRWLWPEALRVLRESMPAWAIFENPPGILSLESGVVFERLLAEMESYGYSVQPILVPACAVDAKHRRDRVWIVANTTGGGRGPRRTASEGQQRKTASIIASSLVAHSDKQHVNRSGNGRLGWRDESPDGGEGLSDAQGVGCERQRTQRKQITEAHAGTGVSVRRSGQRYQWATEPNVGRVAHGIPSRVDRLRCLGNAIVPQVAKIFARAIKQGLIQSP